MSLELSGVSKSFGALKVISGLSLQVREGAIFGFLGPNGAGKTTTMRMILDIFRPDSGRITWRGVPVGEVDNRCWGYLPEERGLYPKMKVTEQLVYLARLNGLSRSDATAAAESWLERFEIGGHSNKNVEELSKGNQQKVQFLAAVLHNPDVLIMDEPFSALDPINAGLLKGALLDLHKQGKTIIFSTHQLEQVEELCQDIVLINKGRPVIQGNLREIKRGYGRTKAILALDNDTGAAYLDSLPGVRAVNRRRDYIELAIKPGMDPNAIVEAALKNGGVINRFELSEPTLTEIFIERVGALGQQGKGDSTNG